ncbi:MAG: hypothetical protein IT384_32285 [Deltaproteobacteria bacterium]|nr:hypothetical protein [Deltaproteobacteria bacterium]
MSLLRLHAGALARFAGALSAVLSGALACDKAPELVLVDPEIDLAVLYVESGGVPISVEVIRPSSTEAERRKLASDATLAVVVPLDATGLATEVEDFEPGRIAELAVRLAPPPSVPGPAELIDGRVFRAAALPVGAAILSARLEGGGARFTPDAEAALRVRGAVTLLIPSSVERCAPPDGGMEIFADLDDRFVIDLAWITEDLLLVHGVVRLVLVRRSVGPVAVLDSHDFVPSAPELARFGLLAVDPRTRPDGRSTVWASACSSATTLARDCAVGTARLLRLEAGPDGFSNVRTATVVPTGPGLIEPAVDALGRVLLAYGYSRFFTLEGDPPVMRPLDPPPIAADSPHPDSIAPTADLARPFLIGFKSSVHQLEWESRTWRTWAVGGLERIATYALASYLDAGATDLEIWTAGTHGRMFRKPAHRNEFERIDPVLPIRLAACANAERHAVDDIVDVELDREVAYVAMGRCSAAVRIRRNDLCASTISESEGPAASTIVSPMQVAALRFGRVAFVRLSETETGTGTGTGSRIFEIPAAP